MKKTVSSLSGYIALTVIFILSCEDHSDDAPTLVITRFYPNSGIIGTHVTIYGNNFIPAVTPPAGPLTNTSIVKFNGTLAVADFVYQDSIGKQRINTMVPVGATNGKITVTANGMTVSSINDFVITTPIYVPNVAVTTIANYGARGIALDADGNMYLTVQTQPPRILRITPSGVVTELFTAPGRSIPFGIAVDIIGNVYAVVDHTIIKITSDGTVSTLAGSTAGYADGQGVDAQFAIPWGIAVDASGNVYVADIINNKIRKITHDGMVSTLAGSTAGYSDGQGANAKFSYPWGIATDVAGNVFITEGNRIRKITPGGNVTTVAGSTGGYYDALGTTAQFNSPYGIAVTASGNIFITDISVIRKIAPDGHVTTVAGSTFGSSDGSGEKAKFGNTKGVVVDVNGIIYLADQDNGRICKIVIN